MKKTLKSIVLHNHLSIKSYPTFMKFNIYKKRLRKIKKGLEDHLIT